MAKHKSKPSFERGNSSKRNHNVRKSVLGKQLQALSSGHKGTFIDKRIGAKLTSDPEEAAMMRFIKQKQLKAMQSKAEEDDDEEEQILLTHNGEQINFDALSDEEPDRLNPDLDSDDDVMGRGDTSARLTHALHFGEGEADVDHPARKKKSSAEIYAEVIAKSKASKAEKRQQKTENEELMLDLDDKFNQLRQSNSVMVTNPNQSSDDDDDGYAEFAALADRFGNEAKVQASERTITEEEKAKRLFQKLQQMEEERKKGQEIIEEEVSDETSEESEIFDESDSEGQKTKDQSSESEDDDVIAQTDDVIAQKSHVSKQTIHPSRLAQMKRTTTTPSTHPPPPTQQTQPTDGLPLEIPFVLGLPLSEIELNEYLLKVEPELYSALFARFYYSLHPSLGPEAKEKAKQYLLLLFKFVVFVMKDISVDNIYSNLFKINSTVFVMERLINFFPKSTGVIAMKKLKIFSNLISNSSNSGPNYFVFLFLSWILNLFPHDQKSHPVVNSACFVLSKLITTLTSKLNQIDCNQGNQDDVSQLLSKSIFVLNLVSVLSKGQSRYFPESILLSREVISNLVKLKLPLQTTGELSLSSLLKSSLIDIDLVGCAAFDCVQNLIKSFSLDSCFPMLAEPFIKVLGSAKSDLCSSLIEFLEYLKLISEKSIQLRLPLKFQAHKPIPIRQYKPSFSIDFDPELKGSLDVDQNRRESKRLEHVYKNEHRGAVREVRKDFQYVAQQKKLTRKLQKQKAEEGRKRLFSQLEQEAAEYNKLDKDIAKERDKKRKRRER
ncbi:hypothetical protein P9112_005426 [Eukaryota sp. TZLM1-RC]